MDAPLPFRVSKLAVVSGNCSPSSTESRHGRGSDPRVPSPCAKPLLSVRGPRHQRPPCGPAAPSPKGGNHRPRETSCRLSTVLRSSRPLASSGRDTVGGCPYSIVILSITTSTRSTRASCRSRPKTVSRECSPFRRVDRIVRALFRIRGIRSGHVPLERFATEVLHLAVAERTATSLAAVGGSRLRLGISSR